MLGTRLGRQVFVGRSLDLGMRPNAHSKPVPDRTRFSNIEHIYGTDSATKSPFDSSRNRYRRAKRNTYTADSFPMNDKANEDGATLFRIKTL